MIFILNHGHRNWGYKFMAEAAVSCEVHAYHLTHWGQVTHIYVSKLTTTGSVNGLLPGLRQAII